MPLETASCLSYPSFPILHSNTVMVKDLPYVILFLTIFSTAFALIHTATNFYCRLRSYWLSFLLNDISVAELHVMGADKLFH